MSDVRMLYSAPRITALLGRHVPACTQLARVSPGPRWVKYPAGSLGTGYTTDRQLSGLKPENYSITLQQTAARATLLKLHKYSRYHFAFGAH